MATKRKDSELDVVQADTPGPSVLIPYPGSVLPASPVAVTPAARAESDEDDSDAEDSDDAEGSDDGDDEDSADEDSDDEDEEEEEEDDNEDSDEAPTRASTEFFKSLTPSPQLALIVGSEPITRVEVTKRVWNYIAKNKLQDQANRRMINLDATLKGIFGDQQQINMFEMTKLLFAHLS